MPADLPAIPPALVEAAARALYNANRPKGTDWWALGDDGGDRDLYRSNAAAILAAALAECEVREEVACPDGDGGLGWHTHRCPDVTHERLVITTKPEPVASPVDTPREDRP